LLTFVLFLIITYIAALIKDFMKRVFLEKNIVIVLFVLVLITFSFAHHDSKKLSQFYSSVVKAGKKFLAQTNAEKSNNLSPANN